MKKNNKKNDYVTKDYLDKKLKDLFIESKNYTDKRFDRLFKYLDHKFEPLNELKRDFDKFNDSTNKNLDWIVKKLEKYDQEYTIMSAKYPYFLATPIALYETRMKLLKLELHFQKI